jgi:hypothetical protein
MRRGSFCAIKSVSSSASARLTWPISLAVAPATSRFPRSSAHRKIVRGWACEVDLAPLRGRDDEASLKRHSPTRGGGSPKAPAGQAAVLPSSALFRGSDPSQLSHLVIPVARGCKSGPELVCMPLPAPGERAGSPQNVLATSHLRGKRLSWAHTMICVSRGPAFGPCGWPNASGGERMTAAPALEHLCPAPKQVQGSSAHQRLEVVAGPGPGCVVVQNYERKMRLFRVSRSVVADINSERAGRELPRWGRSGRHP